MERLLSRRCLEKECVDWRERTGESGGEVVKTEERKVGERTARKTKKKEEEGREQEKREGGAEGD